MKLISHNVVSNAPRLSWVRTRNVSGDTHWLQWLYDDDDDGSVLIVNEQTDQLNTVKKSSICTGTQNNFILCENITINDIVALLWGWYPIDRFNPSTFVCLSQASTWVSTAYVVLLCVQWVQLRWEVIVHVVDIGGVELIKKFAVMTLTWVLWTLGSVASSLNEICKRIANSGILYQLRYNFPFAGTVGLLQHINGKFTIVNMKRSLLSWNFVLNPLSLSISRYRSVYEADQAVSVVSFISRSMGYKRSP